LPVICEDSTKANGKSIEALKAQDPATKPAASVEYVGEFCRARQGRLGAADPIERPLLAYCVEKLDLGVFSAVTSGNAKFTAQQIQ